MTGAAPAILSDLPKGHHFADITLALTPERIARYVEALGDANCVYEELGLAPPLAVTAFALGALLDAVGLAPGTLHTNQEMEVLEAVPLRASLTLRGTIAQRSERAGMVISVIEFSVTPEGSSEPALRGRTMVMSPAAAEALP